ncbi:unnamed protein product [Meloidogyne enterolobii]|uniref:Uncharacterized protein n=2 Tax=Meloidogyne enterolobii TaxID=390850 RepID=A0ACB0XUA8_MELEN|nr:unnamed protein product [Meloidogyne enterolobii]
MNSFQLFFVIFLILNIAMITSVNGGDFFADCCNFLCHSCFLNVGILCQDGNLVELKSSLLTQCKQAGHYCSNKWSKLI